MSYDLEVVEAIWSGQIPACFKLAPHECIGMQQPEPFFVMLPRISYLPFLWDSIQKHFSRHVSEEHRSSPIWLDYNLCPLRWQLPIGLLYDLYVDNQKLPWTITVHFTDFPVKEVIPCPTKQVAEAHFLQTLKEADYLKTHNKVITTLTLVAKRQLINALVSSQPKNFWQVNKSLMFTSDKWKHIPLKVFFAKSRKCIQQLVKYSQKSNATDDESPHELSLGEVLQEWVEDFSEENYEVTLHGVPVPLHASLFWLAQNMSFADNFLYVILNDRRILE